MAGQDDLRTLETDFVGAFILRLLHPLQAMIRNPHQSIMYRGRLFFLAYK